MPLRPCLECCSFCPRELLPSSVVTCKIMFTRSGTGSKVCAYRALGDGLPLAPESLRYKEPGLSLASSSLTYQLPSSGFRQIVSSPSIPSGSHPAASNSRHSPCLSSLTPLLLVESPQGLGPTGSGGF